MEQFVFVFSQSWVNAPFVEFVAVVVLAPHSVGLVVGILNEHQSHRLRSWFWFVRVDCWVFVFFSSIL